MDVNKSAGISGYAAKREIFFEMYKRMNQARFFEEKVNSFFARGMIHGTTHLSIGQEASAVAAAMAMEKGDLASLTHRGHSQLIGWGVDLNKMMAELLGRKDGYCGGKGGSMHIADMDQGILGANGIVGGGFGIAVGAALTQKMQKTGHIVLCFFGDGASNEGSFHENINLASIWKLPVIFFCENNQYGMSMSAEKSMNITDVSLRSTSYGIPGYSMDGNDALEVYNKMVKIAATVREGHGPVLVEAKTYRWMGHSKSDANAYRTKEEIDSWKKKDPILRLERSLLHLNLATQEQLHLLREEARGEIEEAVEFAQNSPQPEMEDLMKDIFA